MPPSTFDSPRFPPIPPEDYTPAQKRVIDHYAAGWQGRLPGMPRHHHMTLRSPEYALRIAQVSDYFRGETSLPQRLNELAILLVARQMESQFEWHLHSEWAVKAGLDARIVHALPAGGKPAGLSADEDIVYDFVVELQRTKRVSDATFTRTKAALGEQQYADLVAVVGFYTLVAMALAAAGPDVPDWKDGAVAAALRKPTT
jgi:4-carboxymuconolactone decarboxylase